MPKFSERIGIEKPKQIIQTSSMDEGLRTDLFNAYYESVIGAIDFHFHSNQDDFERSFGRLWTSYFRQPLDVYEDINQVNKAVRGVFFSAKWYDVYNLMEAILKIFTYPLIREHDYVAAVTHALQSNLAGFTLYNKEFIPITSNVEVEEIDDLNKNVLQYRLKGIKEHLDSAITLLSLKPKPDLRNSVKESISMVGVIARLIENENDLAKALTVLSKKGKINDQLIAGFKNLYYFTSGKDGIRHELMDDPNLDFETAKYFLVSCSAFANFLISEAIARKILK